MKVYKYIFIFLFLFTVLGAFAQNYDKCTENYCASPVAASLGNISGDVKKSSNTRNESDGYIKNIDLSDYDKEVNSNENLVVVYITKKTIEKDGTEKPCAACKDFERLYFNNTAEYYSAKGVKFVSILITIEKKITKKDDGTYTTKPYFNAESNKFFHSWQNVYKKWMTLNTPGSHEVTPAILLVKRGEILSIHAPKLYNNSFKELNYAITQDIEGYL